MASRRYGKIRVLGALVSEGSSAKFSQAPGNTLVGVGSMTLRLVLRVSSQSSRSRLLHGKCDWFVASSMGNMMHPFGKRRRIVWLAHFFDSSIPL